MATKKIVPVQIRIPDDLDFSALKLGRNPTTGAVEFDWAPIERICAASRIDPSLLTDQPQDNVAELIVGWYHEHLKRGGACDPIQEDIMSEVAEEDARGGLSHEPGRA